MNNQGRDPNATFAGFFMFFIAMVFGYLVMFPSDPEPPTQEEVDRMIRQKVERVMEKEFGANWDR